MINREAVGLRLTRFAWGVEILAAVIGLIIAALIVLDAAQKIEATSERGPNYLDIFLGGLPFVVVAMVELTKIPLATACYTAASRLAKTVFAAALVVLSIITFETILNGFE